MSGGPKLIEPFYRTGCCFARYVLAWGVVRCERCGQERKP